jgi:hypothetical protein
VRLLVLVLVAGNALAQGAPEDRQRAEALARVGADAVQRGDWPLALEQFRAAYQIYPSANLRYDIGVALAAVGRYVEALDELHAFVDGAPGAPADARAFALARIAELERRVGHLTLDAPKDAQLTVNGSVLSIGQSSLRVIPGNVTIAMSLAGHCSITERASLTAGESRVVRLACPPAHALVPPTEITRETAHRRRSLKTATAVVGSIGIASIIGGAVLGGLAQSASDELSRINRDGLHFDPSLERNGKAFQAGEGALLAIGSAAVIAGVATLVAARRAR